MCGWSWFLQKSLLVLKTGKKKNIHWEFTCLDKNYGLFLDVVENDFWHFCLALFLSPCLLSKTNHRTKVILANREAEAGESLAWRSAWTTYSKWLKFKKIKKLEFSTPLVPSPIPQKQQNKHKPPSKWNQAILRIQNFLIAGLFDNECIYGNLIVSWKRTSFQRFTECIMYRYQDNRDV